jgi:hypothetical protein
MGRLIPGALYSNELIEEHYLRDIRMGEESCDGINPEARWDTLAGKIRQIDPFGQRSRALLALVESKE